MDENYYPQKSLEECTCIDEELVIASDNSDDFDDSDVQCTTIVLLKYKKMVSVLWLKYNMSCSQK